LNQSQSTGDDSSLPTIAVAVGAAIWGVYWIPLRYVDELGMSGAWAVVIAAALPLSVLLPLTCKYWREIRPDLRAVVLIGLFTGLALAFYAMGLVYTSVVRATMLYYLTPIWSTIFSMIMLREQVRWNRWVAILVGLVGLYFILGGASDLTIPINIGDCFGLVAGITWGIGAVHLKQNPGIATTGAVTSQHLFSLLGALACCLLLPGIDGVPPWPVWVAAAPGMWLYSCIALVPSLYAIFWASGKLFPGRVGVLMMTEVLVAVVSASLLLNEQIQLLEWVGVMLILFAGILEVFGSNESDSQVSR
jgi:drug/metabolite transporter (DMT)-like permease